MGKYYIYNDKTKYLFDTLGISVIEYEEFARNKKMNPHYRSTIDYVINGILNERIIKIKKINVLIDLNDKSMVEQYLEFLK